MNLTPLKAIRRNCIDCVGKASDVRDCRGNTMNPPCPFYQYRLAKGRPKLRIIRQHCLWCMGGSTNLVRDCHSQTCQFHVYRSGHSLKRKGLSGRSYNFKLRKPEKDIHGKGSGITAKIGQKTQSTA